MNTLKRTHSEMIMDEVTSIISKGSNAMATRIQRTWKKNRFRRLIYTGKWYWNLCENILIDHLRGLNWIDNPGLIFSAYGKITHWKRAGDKGINVWFSVYDPYKVVKMCLNSYSKSTKSVCDYIIKYYGSRATVHKRKVEELPLLFQMIAVGVPPETIDKFLDSDHLKGLRLTTDENGCNWKYDEKLGLSLEDIYELYNISSELIKVLIHRKLLSPYRYIRRRVMNGIRGGYRLNGMPGNWWRNTKLDGKMLKETMDYCYSMVPEHKIRELLLPFSDCLENGHFDGLSYGDTWDNNELDPVNVILIWLDEKFTKDFPACLCYEYLDIGKICLNGQESWNCETKKNLANYFKFERISCKECNKGGFIEDVEMEYFFWTGGDTYVCNECKED